MAKYSDFGTQGKIYQPESDDESDNEYFDSIPFFEDSESNSTRLRKSDITVSGSFSEIVPGIQTENLVDYSNLRAGNSRHVLDPNKSSQDVHSSSGESKSSGSLIDQAYKIKKVQDEYFDIVMVDKIDDSHVEKLMQTFSVLNFSTKLGDSEKLAEADSTVSKCRMLYERDYHCEIVDNSGGVLCENYPVRLIVPVRKKSDRSEGVDFDPNIYTEEAKKSASCRIRKRFVTPVIMFDKKFICRSGTITVRKTAAFETAIKSPNPQAESVDDSPVSRTVRNIARAVLEISSQGWQAAAQFFTPDSIKKLRDIDAQIIRDLKVQSICDLMIEDRKEFGYVRLSSSEKINPDIYRDCNIEQMPYPGCKFFRRYHRANRNPEGLIFNWERPDANTVLKLTEDPSENFPDIEWDNYKEWDLPELTKNYMRILLLYLAKRRGGLLVHCISGWDRTPLFISILRVSLWADGIIHESLNYKDMAYLTLAYDWYLFGHVLPSRLQKREEILHFCFKFLQYIANDEFSLTRIFNQLPIEQRENGSIPDFKPGARAVINDLCSYVLNVYDKIIPNMLRESYVKKRNS